MDGIRYALCLSLSFSFSFSLSYILSSLFPSFPVSSSLVEPYFLLLSRSIPGRYKISLQQLPYTRYKNRLGTVSYCCCEVLALCILSVCSAVYATFRVSRSRCLEVTMWVVCIRRPDGIRCAPLLTRFLSPLLLFLALFSSLAAPSFL